MNFGLGHAQIVEFSPALPYHGAFFFRTNQHGSFWNQYSVRVRTVRCLSQMICWWCRNPIRNRPAEASYMKHRTEGHTETTISGDTRADWSDAFALVPSLQIAYVWHASLFTREVLDGAILNQGRSHRAGRSPSGMACGLPTGAPLRPGWSRPRRAPGVDCDGCRPATGLTAGTLDSLEAAARHLPARRCLGAPRGLPALLDRIQI